MKKSAPIGLIVVGLVFFAAGLAAVFYAGGFGVCFGAVFAAVGGFMAFMGVKQLVAQSAFEDARLDAGPPVPLGGTARLVLYVKPKRPLTMNPKGCTVRVRTTERARYSAGTSSRTYEDVLHDETLPLELPRVVDAPLEHRVSVLVPRTIPPTWSGQNNWFTTRVSVHLDIDSWPDLELDAELDVLPEVARG